MAIDIDREGVVAARVHARLLVGASMVALCMAQPAFAQSTGGTAAGQAGTQSTVEAPGVEQSGQDDGGESIVVTGFRQSLQSAQSIKRNSDVIVDSVTAEDIGALPDRSVTETLQRIPGVSINRFAAGVDPDHFSVEGSGVVVRGLTYVRSEFNGRDSFSAGNQGGLSFQDVPSELLGGVDVFKSPSADRIEGGIAGVVNLRTRRPFDQAGRLLSLNVEMNYGDFINRGAPNVALLGSNRWSTGIGEIGVLASVSYSQLFSRADSVAISSFRVRPIYSDGTRTDTVAFTGATQVGSGLFPRGAVLGSQEFNRERYGYAGALQWRSNDGSMEATAQFLRSDARQAWTENVIEIATDNVFDNGDSRARVGTSLEFDDSGLFHSGIITGPTGWRADQNTDGRRRTPAVALPSNNIAREHLAKNVTSDYSFNFRWDVTSRLGLNLDYQRVQSNNRVVDNGLWMRSFQDAYIRLNGADVPDLVFLPPQTCEGVCTGVPGGSGAYPSYLGPDNPNFTDPANNMFRSAMEHLEESRGTSDAARIDLEYSFDEGSFLRAIRVGGRYADRRTEARHSAYAWGVLSEQWGGGDATTTPATPGGPIWADDLVNGTTPNDGGNPTNAYWSPYFYSNFLQGRMPDPLGGSGRLFYSAGPASNVQLYRDFARSLAREWRPGVTCAIDGRLINDGFNPLNERCGVLSGSDYLPGEINPQTERNKAGYIMARFGSDFSNGMRFDGNAGVRYTSTRRISAGFQSFPVNNSLPSDTECAAAIDRIVNPEPDTPPGQTLQPFCALTGQERASVRSFTNGAVIDNNFDTTYDYFLPSVNVRLQLNPQLQFRAAYNKGVFAPSPGLVRNFFVVSLQAQPLFDTNGNAIPIVVNPDGTVPAGQVRVEGTANAGNPGLTPIEADNFDLTAEWYFSELGSFTISGFYKRLTGVLTNDIVRRDFENGGASFSAVVTTPVNSTDVGHIRGFEVGYQQTYDFLPGPLSGLGLQANYTFVSSSGVPQSTLNPTDPAVAAGNQPTITGDNFPLQGLSKHQFNITPFFDIGPLSVRATYNWRSDFLLTLRDVIVPYDPIFQRAYGQLDASAFITVNPSFRIGVQGVNLTNSMTVTEAAVVDQNGDIRRVPRRWYVADRRFSIVARMNF